MAMRNLVKIWHTKVLVFLWYGPSLYLLFQFSKLFGNPPSNIEAPSNKLYTVQYRSKEKFSHANKFYFLRSILAINIEILISHVELLSKYLQNQVVFIGSAQADPTVLEALRGKNTPSIAPPSGAEGPAQQHTPTKRPDFQGTICTFSCGKFQRVLPLVFML